MTDPLSGESLEDRITARLATMTRSERQVAEYLRHNTSEVIFATAEQIGRAAGASNATVVRTARTLGYAGLQELRQSLGRRAVEATSPFTELRKRLDSPGSQASGLLAHVFNEAAERLAETLRRADAEEFTAAVETIAAAREVLCFGIGPAELVARYCALRLGRIGRRARSTGSTGFKLADDLIGLGPGDVVVLYSPGRLLTEIEVVLDHAASVGTRSVLISDTLGPLFTDRVDVSLAAAHSAGNIVGEGLGAQVLTDALLLGVAAHDEQHATSTTQLLIELRSSLTRSGPRPSRASRSASGGGSAPGPGTGAVSGSAPSATGSVPAAGGPDSGSRAQPRDGGDR